MGWDGDSGAKDASVARDCNGSERGGLERYAWEVWHAHSSFVHLHACFLDMESVGVGVDVVVVDMILMSLLFLEQHELCAGEWVVVAVIVDDGKENEGREGTKEVEAAESNSGESSILFLFPCISS